MPFDKYKDDPIAYLRDVFGIDARVASGALRDMVANDCAMNHLSFHAVPGRPLEWTKLAQDILCALPFWWVDTRKDGRVLVGSATRRYMDHVMLPNMRELAAELTQETIRPSGMDWRWGGSIDIMHGDHACVFAGYSPKTLVLLGQGDAYKQESRDALVALRRAGAPMLLVRSSRHDVYLNYPPVDPQSHRFDDAANSRGFG